MKINVSISPSVRRRFILGKQGLWPGRRWTGKDGTEQALRTVEAVQVDPVAILAPSHDIVLWGRVLEYQPGYTEDFLYVEHKFFDYGGAVMIYPIEELPYWRLLMERRKVEKRWADFAKANLALLDEVRQELRLRGPLRNRDIEGRAVSHYRASKDTGVALYYLWLTGEIMTHSRQNGERVFDFLEHIAPPDLQRFVAEDAAVQFFMRKTISHVGLVNEHEFRRVFYGMINRPVDAKEAKHKLSEMVEGQELGVAYLESNKEYLYFPFQDLEILENLQDGKEIQPWQPIETTTSEEVIFLSPLEYVSTRGRAKPLFDFDIIWEIYKPAEKRQYGPYTMPVLYADRLVARIDLKLDRQKGILLINGLWLEGWFAPDEAFSIAFAKGLHRFARFMGVNRVDTSTLTLEILKSQVDYDHV